MSLLKHSIRVLLIADDEDDYIIVRDLLTEYSCIKYILKWVSDYGAALDAILADEFDVCLLDYRFEEQKGLELMQEAVSRGAMIPIVFLIDQGDYDLDLEAVSKGAADCLTKGELSATFLERSIRLAIERQRKRQELAKAKRVIQALSECNHAVMHIKDETELLRAICRIVVDVVGYRMAWVGYSEEDQDQTVTPVAGYGYEKDYLETVRVAWKDAERGRGPTGTCIRTGIPAIIRSVGTQAEFAPWKVEASRRGYASVIGLPLLLGGQRLGALTIYASETDAFDTEEVDFLVGLSSNLSYGIGFLRLQKAQLQAEQSLKEAYLDLERRVEERTAEFIVRDLTERERTQRTVWQSEAVLRSLLEATPAGVGLLVERVFAKVNAALCRITGYSEQEMVGMSTRILYPDDEEFFGMGKELYEGMEQTGLGMLESCLKRKDGTFIDVLLCLSPFDPMDASAGVTATVLDITDRKRAEEELKESEQLLKSIIQGYPIPTFMIGKDHRVIHWNRALEEFTGLEASEVVGTSLHWRAFYREERPCMADLLVNEDQEAILRWYGERTCKSEVLEEAYEAIQFFPDLGETGKWLRFTSAAIRNSKGVIVGAIETLEDITDREKAEEVLKESENRYRAIFENTVTATIILEEDTIISLANAEFEKLTGYSRDEIENKKSWTAFVVPEDLEAMLGQHRLRRTEANFALNQYEFRLIDRHNQIKHCLLSIDMIADTKKSIASLLDISERKKAEEALISKNRELNDIIEFLPDATVVIDQDRKIIAWNRAIEEMTGVDKKEVLGKPDRDCTVFFYGESRPSLLDLLDAGEEDLESKYRYVERKGEVLYAETYIPCVYGGRGAIVFATAAPLFDVHGNRVGAIESIRDITESKKKEEALLESQQQLSDIINFLPDATLVIDKEGRVIAWNRAMEEMTGIQAADMLGKDNFEYALPFYGKRRPILIDLVLRPQEEVEDEYEHLERKETVIAGEAYMPALRGGEAYLLGTASALFDSRGNVVGAIESMRDITERRRVEEALASAEEKYRSIFENAMEGIYQTTVAGRCIDANPALAIILGYDSPEDLMDTLTDISGQLYVDPEHRVELLRLIEEYGSVREFETQYYRKDRSIAWISLNMHSVLDKNGKVAYLEGTVQDITDRKALESRLIQSQKMEAIGTLAGGIAHDFNNILAAIIGYSEIIRMRFDEPTLHGFVEQILRSSDRARDLVKHILTFSRKTEQERRPVQVSLLVKETHQMLLSTLPSTVEIRREIDREAINSTVMADPTQIHQVLMNLCTNAAHAMREKGGVLSITLAKVDIDSTPGAEIPDLETGSYLRLSVSDTGHGMDEEVRQRIFDPYFTTKGPDEGTGLGLAVVYGIVKDLPGGITVSSNPGEGTTFRVFFPIFETGETTSVAVSGRLATGKGRILIVDDEKYVVEMLKLMLGQLGYEVAARYSSSDALEAFQAQPERFDLVISDQTMPHMTGTDLAKEILKIRPDIPIILCTGFSAMIDEARARKIGIKAFLMKPMALQQLAEEIRKLLNQE
ncbi:MAG: PAS domain S-box protein [Syntrophobacteraceae bacterium]